MKTLERILSLTVNLIPPLVSDLEGRMLSIPEDWTVSDSIICAASYIFQKYKENKTLVIKCMYI